MPELLKLQLFARSALVSRVDKTPGYSDLALPVAILGGRSENHRFDQLHLLVPGTAVVAVGLVPRTAAAAGRQRHTVAGRAARRAHRTEK